MKKLALILSVMLILLVGCGNKDGIGKNNERDISENNGNKVYSRVVSPYQNICTDGELYVAENGARLSFIDFTTMKSTLICAKPNCLHNDSATCSSFGMSNLPILTDKNIYFFDMETAMKNGKVLQDTILYRADIDGTNRVKIGTIEGMVVMSSAVLVDDMLYFCPTKYYFDEFGNQTGQYNGYLFSYSFKENKFTEILELKKGFTNSVVMLGEYNGGIYYITNYLKEEIDWAKVMSDPDFDVSSIEYISDYYRYDINDKEIQKLDFGVYYAQGGVLITKENDKYILNNRDGSELTLPDSYSDFITVAGNKLFDRIGEYVIDLETTRMYKLLIKNNSSDYADVIYYIDGSYIIRHNMTHEYEKLPEDKVIGAEIE